MSKFIPQGMGWIPDLPDPRDYTYQHKEVLPIFQNLRAFTGENPDEVDLRYGDEGEIFFTDVEDQGPLNSSTAFAVLSLVEYLERRVHGRTFDGSKLFLYKTTRNLRNKQSTVSGDTGADLRTTLKALRQFGVPSEDHWPYDVDRFDQEPGPFAYQATTRFNDIRYFRLSNHTAETLIGQLKSQWNLLTSFLAAGFPVAFGVAVPSSLSTSSSIVYRTDLDHVRGGQAVVAVGYRLNHFARNQHAILVRSSWGSSWGENGYGWLQVTPQLQCITGNLWVITTTSMVECYDLFRPITKTL